MSFEDVDARGNHSLRNHLRRKRVSWRYNWECIHCVLWMRRTHRPLFLLEASSDDEGGEDSELSCEYL